VWRRSFEQIGGGYALTLVAWVVTLPLSILFSLRSATTTTTSQQLTWIAAVIGVQCVLGVVMLIAHYLWLPARPRRSRPKTALSVFVLLGVLRGLLLHWAQLSLGFGDFSLTERIATNIVAVTIVFAALALIIDNYKTDVSISRRLAAAQESLKQYRSREVAELHDLDQQILIDIQSSLETSLDSASQRETNAITEIVRSASHELMKGIDVTTLITTNVTRPSRGVAIAQVASRMKVPSPLVVLIPYELIMISLLISRVDSPLFLVNMFLGVFPAFAGLWLLNRFLPLPSNGILRILLITLTSSAVFILSLNWHVWVESWIPLPSEIPILNTTLGLVEFTLVVSVWRATTQGGALRQQAMAEAVSEQARELTRLQSIVDQRRSAAARFLHGTVQNELVLAAMRGDADSEVHDAIHGLFEGYATDSDPTFSPTQFDNLLASWGAVLEINTQIDPSTWETLANEPVRAAAFMDVVCEGLINTIRHASGPHVGLNVEVIDSDITIHFTTEGSLSAQSRTKAGIGVTTLAQSTKATSLASAHGTTTLTVSL
jgi:signal transduction histidine kinase